MKRVFLIITAFLFPACLCLQAANKRALLIGLSSYAKYSDKNLSWPDIHGTNDVAVLKNTLSKQGFAVTVLTDRHATADRIRKAFILFASRTKNGDLVYIHFSGHGQPVEDINGDEADGWDESIVPYDAAKCFLPGVYEGDNHIIDDELNGYVNKIRKRAGTRGFVYVVIDACHAGGMYKGSEDNDSIVVRGTCKGFSRNNKPYIPKIDTRPVIRIDKLKGASGACYVEACRAYQRNSEIKARKRYYGSLSYYITEC